MKVSDVINCSFENWYNNFKHITAKSYIIPLPDGFVSYLLKDGIILPKSEEAPSYANINEKDDDGSEVDWDSSDSDTPEAPHFPSFDDEIKKTLEKLGGSAFPKLNWTSPRDAAWVALNNSYCCKCLTDVYLLLKSSDFIVHDLTAPFLCCEDYVWNSDPSSNLYENLCLILRKWEEVLPSGEYRCFVKDGSLIGVCQRDTSSFFEHIGQQRNYIIQDIVSFFIEHIQFKFPSTDFTFDVYRKKDDKVYLIDFNPFGKPTDSLLFSWDELNGGLITTGDHILPEFRFVCQNHGVQPKPISYHAMPRDIVDISTGEDSFKLVDLMKLNIGEQNENPSDEDIDQ